MLAQSRVRFWISRFKPPLPVRFPHPPSTLDILSSSTSRSEVGIHNSPICYDMCPSRDGFESSGAGHDSGLKPLDICGSLRTTGSICMKANLRQEAFGNLCLYVAWGFNCTVSIEADLHKAHSKTCRGVRPECVCSPGAPPNWPLWRPIIELFERGLKVERCLL